MIKRCVSLALAVLLLVMLTVPVSAEEVTSRAHGFWDNLVQMWMHNGENLDIPLVGMVGNWLLSGTSGDACSSSEDHLHHGTTGISREGGTDPKYGSYINAKCRYCGAYFKAYAADFQNAYDEYTGDMQNQYGTVNFNYLGCPVYPLGPFKYSPHYDGHYVFTSNHTSGFSISADGTLDRVSMYLYSMQFSLPRLGEYAFHFDYSFSNLFSLAGHSTVQVTFNGVNPNFNRDILDLNTAHGGSGSGSVDWAFSSSESKISVNDALQLIFFAQANKSGSGSFTISNCYLVSLTPPSDVPVSETRVGTFSGNFGYYGDNGQMVLAENISIVNETNNTFHNPVTGDTAPVSSWTYDYGDRSYDITLDSGDTVTVTYGDENVTIVQGGNTYNVYYIVEQGGGEPEPTPTPPPTPTPTPPVPTPTVPPGPEPTEPVDPDAPPDTSGWGILDFLKGIFDFLFGLVKKILDGLSALIQKLLQPSEESINKLQSQVEEKLPFISDLKGFGDDFANALKNPLLSAADNQYTTVVDIGAKKGGVSYGTGQVNLLDVSWYLEYKPMGDAIIEGVCWLSFLWNLYGAVPGIIHGAASGVYSTGEIKRWKDGHEE